MTTSSCLKWIRVACLMTGMAGLAVSVNAQATAPTPNFSVSWYPNLAFNVWPADFNEDGRTDLIAADTMQTGPGARPNRLLIAIGRGDGTFTTPTPVGLVALPLNVGDFNADGFIDVVIAREERLEILPGRGNGTFAAPVAVDAYQLVDELRDWAHTADIDGDGRRDIVVAGRFNDVKWYRGNGNFTFQTPVELPIVAGGYQPSDATSGDFNGDGRRDLAVVSQYGIDLFLRTGPTTFSASVISSPGGPLTDVTAWDMNGDGRLDLVASSGDFEHFEFYVDPGEVLILPGNGNGTFGPAARHSVGVTGAMSVVVGDFNGDGRLDAATSNRSAVFDGDLWMQFVDSISILPGDGTGRLLPATTLTLSDVQPGTFRTDPRYPYENRQHQLNTSNLDGNGRTDLIASPAAILLQRAPAANRPPEAFAGPDRTQFYYDYSLDLGGDGTDPDRHWLTYTWTAENGTVLGRLPWIRVSHSRGETRSYTLTVDDGHGGVDSDTVTVHVPLEFSEGDPFLDVSRPLDGVVRGVPYVVTWDPYDPDHVFESYSISYSVNNGRTFVDIPGCQNLPATERQCTWQNPGPLTDDALLRVTAPGGGRNWIALTTRFSIVASPPGWTSGDIGNVGAPGTTAFAGGTWTVEGSGADIWDRADEFRYVSRAISGSFTITARVASIENLDRWVKAGIMVRETLAAGSRHASLFATPTTERGIAFQRRTTANGLSTHTAGPAVTPPAWLRIGRIGNTISAYYRTSPAAPWVLVGRETLAGLPDAIYVGLAVSSHVDGQLATATFDNVAVDTALFVRSQDVGAVGVAGSTTFDGVVHQVRASGTDIWGTADAFRAVRPERAIASVDFVARVRSIDNTHAWAKAGVMFRDGNAYLPEFPHVMVVVTPGRGIAMQYRPTHGAASIQAGVIAGAAPEWVRLTRVDNQFTGYASEDGVTWRVVGTVTMESPLIEPVLAVTSHDNSRLTTAVFENVEVRRYIAR